jgi:hypothetical protein
MLFVNSLYKVSSCYIYTLHIYIYITYVWEEVSCSLWSILTCCLCKSLCVFVSVCLFVSVSSVVLFYSG